MPHPLRNAVAIVCAFTSFTSVPFSPARTAPSTVPFYMKAKRGAASEKKHAAKNRRASGFGAGFVSSDDPPKAPASQLSKPTEQNSDAETADSGLAVELEEASGAAGDATPHRATVKTPTAVELENPQDEVVLSPETQLVKLPSMGIERRAELRFDRRLSPDELVERFADAWKAEGFAELVVANRDLISERMLYRFTSAILQVETRKTNVETKQEEAHNMRALRQDLIAHCWSYDYPLKAEIQEAEVRLLAVLQGSNVKREVARNCGRTSLEVNCFWIVIFAAVAAWEERGKENADLKNVDMQRVLAEAAEACKQVKECTSRLSPALRAVQGILESADPQTQNAVVTELDEDNIDEIGCFTEQIRLLPTAAYGALVKQMDSILDYMWANRFGVKDRWVQPLRFELPEIERSSRLVEFSKNSSGIQRPE